jgi:hypothetical protein
MFNFLNSDAYGLPVATRIRTNSLGAEFADPYVEGMFVVGETDSMASSVARYLVAGYLDRRVFYYDEGSLGSLVLWAAENPALR